MPVAAARHNLARRGSKPPQKGQTAMGKTNITKAAVALTAGLAAFGVTGFAVAQGGLTANLALSGSFFKITMGHLDGEGFSLFVDDDQKAEEHLPVARIKLEHAKVSDLCLSVTVPKVPGVGGEATLALKAEGEGSVESDSLLVGATDVDGSLVMQDVNVGIDANQLSDTADPGAWGLYSKQVSLKADDVKATSVGAQRLSAKNVGVTVRRGADNGC